ncbi:dihydrofolate reductase [Parasediminibacterium sp. JCM 36343]|uniref:dihydrofolate reductase n=1 Tax=Parasediminibacterium sp. JCM 36343 TaxID=3374279 RepID=UPI00397E4611
MIITHIVAASENNIIGNNYKLLWVLPNDTRFFKNKTWGLPVVMGRKTFVSLGNKPLNGRLNIVLTRQTGFEAAGVKVVQEMQVAIDFCKQEDYKELMVIGGGEIYKQTLAIANKIYLTRVHAIVEGDTAYPALSPYEWKLVFEESFEADTKHQYAYSFQTWVRK